MKNVDRFISFLMITGTKPILGSELYDVILYHKVRNQKRA